VKVLIISNYYPPHERGGYEQLCRDVARHLTERGCVIEVLTSNHGVTAGAVPDDAGVRRLLRPQPIYESSQSVASQFFRQRRSDEAYDLECLRATIGDFRPDVIFFWNLQYLPRSLALEAEKTPGVGVAYWLAGYTPAEPDEFWVYWANAAKDSGKRLIKTPLAKLAQAIMRREGKPNHPRMKHVAVVSEFMRQKGIAEGTLPANAYVLYNGVELDLFQRPVCETVAGPLTLLQAGRVSEDKGVHTAVEAVGMLAQDAATSDIHLHIAGSGPDDYLARLQHIAQRYQAADKVTFHGWLPRDQMPGLMEQSQVLLLPTGHHEPFARVVLEALAGGLTVVSTLTGGTGEIVQHDRTGLTFPAEDSRALAEQIRRLMTESGLRVKLAKQGQQLVLERFSLDRMVENVERLLEQAMADRNQDSAA
jgi:glycosyltransferase involved in cell wall biosynthesis